LVVVSARAASAPGQGRGNCSRREFSWSCGLGSRKRRSNFRFTDPKFTSASAGTCAVEPAEGDCGRIQISQRSNPSPP
jgi:hypothetical protein